MNEFEHLPVEGVDVGIGWEQSSRKRGGLVGRAGGRGGLGGCPGIACNKFYSLLKRALVLPSHVGCD